MDREAGGGDYEGHCAASVNKAAQGHWKEEKGLPQQTAAEAGKTDEAALNKNSERLIGQFFCSLFVYEQHAKGLRPAVRGYGAAGDSVMDLLHGNKLPHQRLQLPDGLLRYLA